jgi:spore maturation protein SpmA
VAPTAIIAPSLVATAIGTTAAVVAAKLLQRLSPQPRQAAGEEAR